MARLQLLKLLVLNLLLIFATLGFSDDELDNNSTSDSLNASSNTSNILNISPLASVKQAYTLTIKGINAMTHTELTGITNWKLINQSTNEVVSFSGENTASQIKISEANASNEKDTKKRISKGEWLVSGVSGDYRGLAVVAISGDKNQLVKVNMLQKVPKVTLFAPDEAIAGTRVKISWEAPAYISGKISLQKADEKPLFYAPPTLYTKSRKEPKAIIELPVEAGDYMLRFYNKKDSKKWITERPIKILPAKIILYVPDEAITGTEIDVAWLAPKESSAIINLKTVDSVPRYNAKIFIKTKGRSKGKLLMPAIPGDYMLRWYSRYDQGLVFERPLKLVEKPVILHAPDIAEPRSKIKITWNAPHRSRARIILVKPELKSKPLAYLDVRGKIQGNMKLPDEEGEFLLLWQNEADLKIMEKHKITLKEKPKELSAPDKKSFDVD